MNKTHSKIIAQVHLRQKHLLSAPGLKLMASQLRYSCQAITFFIGIFIAWSLFVPSSLRDSGVLKNFYQKIGCVEL